MLERLKRYIQNPVFLFILWMAVALVCSLMLIPKETYSNYITFSQAFWHTISSLPLYIYYPEEQRDLFLYGISFTTLISPFALLPRQVGMVLWCLANCGFLYWAIKKLDLKKWQFAVVILISVNDVFTSVLSQQYSIGITAMIIFSYVLIEKEKDFWAALMIVLGTMTKLYGIVGLAFFLFSKHKMKLVGGLVFWAVIVFLLPMLYASPEYVVHSYKEWFDVLVYKNGLNQFSVNQNISLLGMLHRITGASFSDLWIIVPGMILFALPYLRIRQYQYESFRFLFLSSALLFMVLFSTGTETYGYLTAMVAVGVWYVKTPTKAATPILNLSLLIFCILLTSLSTTDLFPRFIRAEYVKPYALKALPCTLIWLKIVWEQLTQDFARPSD
ncbi:glycosyltransferase family 87 protein [Bacteroides thetaiotaomicron]|uniref:glycosyltransferase family 87 protein n=1 Tax=Bacteroides thetaiotaomicron TaxID=818 RepID=UPI0028F4133A|nr:glycosyltransferase family 87 protein [Bacteroides thetaiotaomicron]WOG18485.1 glycosyltransferase family 87 protein [Bacteroides thetaiotaomicron]